MSGAARSVVWIEWPKKGCIRATLISDQSGPFCQEFLSNEGEGLEGFLGQVPLEGRSGHPQDLGGLTGR